MNKLFSKGVVLCLALLFMVSVNGTAQEQRIGTNAASELLIPVGARAIAMGGGSVATVEGVDAIYWNPAGLARSNYTANAVFSHMTYLADINVNYVGVGLNFGGLGTLGFSIKALDIGDIPITTEVAPDGTGGQLSPQFITAGLTYSRALTDRISVGTTINLINETLGRVSASGVAIDIGVQYRDLADISGLSIGVAVKNLGPSMQYGGSGLLQASLIDGADRGSSPLGLQAQKDELPSFIAIGLSYNLSLGETSNLMVAGTFQDNNFQDDTNQLGLEYNYDNLFYARAGYQMSPDAGDDAHIYGMTMGAGIHYDFSSIGITVDYAYRDVDFFDANNVFTVKLGF